MRQGERYARMFIRGGDGKGEEDIEWVAKQTYYPTSMVCDGVRVERVRSRYLEVPDSLSTMQKERLVKWLGAPVSRNAPRVYGEPASREFREPLPAEGFCCGIASLEDLEQNIRWKVGVLKEGYCRQMGCHCCKTWKIPGGCVASLCSCRVEESDEFEGLCHDCARQVYYDRENNETTPPTLERAASSVPERENRRQE